MPRVDAIAWLERLPGVGRKTAACVLLFSFDRPELPVDTHVYRVSSRLELIRPKASFEEAHDVLLALSDPALAAKLAAHKKAMADNLAAKNAALAKELGT